MRKIIIVVSLLSAVVIVPCMLSLIFTGKIVSSTQLAACDRLEAIEMDLIRSDSLKVDYIPDSAHADLQIPLNAMFQFRRYTDFIAYTPIKWTRDYNDGARIVLNESCDGMNLLYKKTGSDELWDFCNCTYLDVKLSDHEYRIWLYSLDNREPIPIGEMVFSW